MALRKYQVIYADPPWPEPNRSGSKETSGRNEPKYPTLSYSEIQGVPVSKIAAASCMLFMWCTWYRMEQGLEVIKAWGFQYSSGLPWIKRRGNGKPKTNFGRYGLPCSELLMIGRRGRAIFPVKPEPMIFDTMVGIHSRKPQEAREWIERGWPNVPKIELFAREKFANWDCWGNEVECDEALNRLFQRSLSPTSERKS